ncbi:hypothetical protein PHYPSEUDO_008670 [Phytophthora pseudosyringae]|uniref:Pentacotripeptide-repeat region of PRORP domain-containing protein n=1 Tax=Phytophthora pseudosyringae TaxID=221518 RepID=A0A8T1VGZ5_9STRA|nr:hypothetical protein PHYPSEUDO_008670 [Phytophthora pseudosyringae]
MRSPLFVNTQCEWFQEPPATGADPPTESSLSPGDILAAASVRRPPPARRPGFPVALPAVLVAFARSGNAPVVLEQFTNPWRSKHQVDAPPPPMDLATTLKAFRDVRDSESLQLTTNQASTLVAALVTHKRHDKCVELLRTCQEHHFPLKRFAQFKGFSVLCSAKEFELALKVFESLRSPGDARLMPWVFAGALDAATKLNRQEVVKDIFQQLVGGEKGGEEVQVGNGEDVYKMLKEVHGREVKLPGLALGSLVVYAEKLGRPEMALEVFSMMQEEGLELTIGVYSSVLVACYKDKRWSDVMRVFEGMPEPRVSQLNNVTLGYVVMAHTQSKDTDVQLRGLDIFGRHKEKWSIVGCKAALDGLLQTGQFDVLLALANDMQRNGIKWGPFVYKMVALAYIRSGAFEKARPFVRDHAKRMKGESAECYRELIEHNANTSEDVEEACQLYVEMIQNKLTLTVAEWCKALELALQFSDHALYWTIRRQLWQNAREVRGDVPAHLLLPHAESSEHHEFEQGGGKT